MVDTKKKVKVRCDNCKKYFPRFLWREVAYKKEKRKKRFCSRECVYEYQKGETNFGYKGGITGCQGYSRYSSGEHKGKRVHNVIMEKHIGKKLKEGEIVHHLNGDIKDNRIENLCLCKNNSEHVRLFHTRKNHQGFIKSALHKED